MNSLNRDMWEEKFDERFVEKIQISEDEFDVGFKGNVQDLYNFIRTLLQEAKAEERKRCLEAVDHFYKEVKYVADKDYKWIDGGHSISSGDLLTVYLESKRMIDQAVSAITNKK